jgi:arabinogalactan oligomer/maltooligosaccharide transport system permease protein
VALQTTLGVVAALLIHQRSVRLKNLWRAIFILPWAIPEFVGAVVWLRIFEPRFGWLHLAALPSGIVLPEWLDNPVSALPVLLIAATWYGFPFIMLAATASLKLIPTDVYHASAIDGANGWAQFRFVTWPLLQPLLIPAIIIRSIFAFNQFYLFYVIQSPFPATTLATVSFFVFNYSGQFAVSAAINVFTVVVLVGLILWFNRRSKALAGVTYV